PTQRLSPVSASLPPHPSGFALPRIPLGTSLPSPDWLWPARRHTDANRPDPQSASSTLPPASAVVIGDVARAKTVAVRAGRSARLLLSPRVGEQFHEIVVPDRGVGWR